MTWEDTAKAKREAVLAQIPKEWIIETPSIEEQPNVIEFLDNVLPANENNITSLSLISLRDKIANSELTSLQVTEAFAHRAALIHQLCNNLSEIFFDKAFKRAKEMDHYLRKYGKVSGPLHGIPISLKDQINLEGMDSAMGFVGLTGKPKTKDEVSIIANILYDSGAVFYVKTAVPVAMLSDDTISNLNGQAVNPINRNLSTGGSSGGESSLIKASGAIIGLSTDIAGSIRVPATFNGIFGIRPSSGRLPYCKVENSFPDQDIVPSVIGPSAKYLNDLKYFFKVILDAKPWLYDPKTPPIPWREYEVPKKLSFGMIKTNGYITPHPPILRALELVKHKLEAAGHEVIEWDPPISHEELKHNLDLIFGADANKWIHERIALSGEPPMKQTMGIDQVWKELLVSEYWELGARKYKSQQIYGKYWLDSAKLTSTGRPVDAWISPAWETTSFPASEYREYHFSYTMVCNYLDYTSLIVPITKVDKSIDRPYQNYTSLNNADKETFELYDPELFNGMPVAVQIITPRYEEERAIALGEVVYELTH